MRHLLDLQAQLRTLGAAPVHEARVLRLWSRALPQQHGRRRLEDFLPRTLRDALPVLTAEWAGLARLRSMHPAADGSARLLVTLADGQTVEAVLLPGRGPKAKAGLCVSSQVGCAVGCRFCMTGVGGLARQLGSAEIVAQVVLARTLRPVHKVVFMGMGEPAHNLDAVLDAITLLGTHGGIGHKDLVFSTVGDERAFERLHASVVKPALALSLHTTQAALREELLPRAPRWQPRELVERALGYAQASGYPLQVQWTLLDGVNDGDDEVEMLGAWLARRPAMVNLIPWNAVDGLPMRRPSPERVVAMARALNARGVLTRLRQSAGQDVEGGCGQLRSREVQPLRVMRPARMPPTVTGS
ncbi:MAG: RNA methyltransferase [Rubrivivax sp.]|nr:RNA methyltransferase [Rubrivivax sp.]